MSRPSFFILVPFQAVVCRVAQEETFHGEDQIENLLREKRSDGLSAIQSRGREEE